MWSPVGGGAPSASRDRIATSSRSSITDLPAVGERCPIGCSMPRRHGGRFAGTARHLIRCWYVFGPSCGCLGACHGVRGTSGHAHAAESRPPAPEQVALSVAPAPGLDSTRSPVAGTLRRSMGQDRDEEQPDRLGARRVDAEKEAAAARREVDVMPRDAASRCACSRIRSTQTPSSPRRWCPAGSIRGRISSHGGTLAVSSTAAASAGSWDDEVARRVRWGRRLRSASGRRTWLRAVPKLSLEARTQGHQTPGEPIELGCPGLAVRPDHVDLPVADASLNVGMGAGLWLPGGRRSGSNSPVAMISSCTGRRLRVSDAARANSVSAPARSAVRRRTGRAKDRRVQGRCVKDASRRRVPQ